MTTKHENRYFIWEDWDALKLLLKKGVLIPQPNDKRVLKRNYIFKRNYILRLPGHEEMVKLRARHGDWVLYAKDVKPLYRALREARIELNKKNGMRDIVRPVLPQSSYDMIKETIFDYWDAIDHFGDTKGFGNVGLILAGPPGVGKTETMRWIAEVGDEKGRRAHKVGFADLQNMLAKGIELSTSDQVILIDDIDIDLLQDRRKTEQPHKLTAQFLTCLDGLAKREGRVMVVSTNENLNNVDPALTRPGRLEHRLNYSYPNRDLMKIFLKDRDIDPYLFDGWSFARVDMFLNKFRVAEYMRGASLKGFYEQFIHQYGEEDETVAAYSVEEFE